MAQVTASCINQPMPCSGYKPYRSSGLFTITSQSQAPSLSECQQNAGPQNIESRKALTAAIRNNPENTYGKKFDKYYEERNSFMAKKFNNLNLTNEKTKKCDCSVHSKKCKKAAENLRKLEENYWAQWKPVKAESENMLAKAKTDISLNLKKQDVSMPQKAASVHPCVKVPIITNYVQCNNCLKFIERDKKKISCGHCKCSDALQTGNDNESCRNRTINECEENNKETLEKSYGSSGSEESKTKTKTCRDGENNTKKVNKENKSVKGDDDCVECQRRRQNPNILYISSKYTQEIPEQDKTELSVTEICPPRNSILLTSGEDSVSSGDGQSMGNDSDNIIKTAVHDMTQYIVKRFTEHINPAYKSNGSPSSRDTSPENNTNFRSEKSAKENSEPDSQTDYRKSSELHNSRFESQADHGKSSELHNFRTSKKYSDSMTPINQAEDKNTSYQNNELQPPMYEPTSAANNNKPLPEIFSRNAQPSTMMSSNANVQPTTIIYPTVDKQLAAMISPRSSIQTATRTSPNANLQSATMASSNVNRPATANTSPRGMQPATRGFPNANMQATTKPFSNANKEGNTETSPRVNMQPAVRTSPNANRQTATMASPHVIKQQSAMTTPNENMQPAIALPPNSNIEPATMTYPNAGATYMAQTNQAQYPNTIVQPSPSVPLADRSAGQSYHSPPIGISNKHSGRSSSLKGHSYPLKAHKVNLLRPSITGAKYKFKL